MLKYTTNKRVNDLYLLYFLLLKDLLRNRQIKYKSEFLEELRKNSKEGYGPDCTVLNTKFSSVTLNEIDKTSISVCFYIFKLHFNCPGVRFGAL